MRRRIRSWFRLACVVAVLWLGWRYAVPFYFHTINPVGARVRTAAEQMMKTRNSRYVTYGQIPAFYREAVIATEDRRFETNIGLDFMGIFRALLTDIRLAQPVQGGSTITQQLVHNTILNNQPKTFGWKMTETIDAVGLHTSMSKAETLTLYVNVIYFGEGAYGVDAAARTYFGRPAGSLNKGELSLLAGLPNAPSVYDPFVNPTLAKQRQQQVLESMVYAGLLTEQQARQIEAEPIRLLHD